MEKVILWEYYIIVYSFTKGRVVGVTHLKKCGLIYNKQAVLWSKSGYTKMTFTVLI